MEADQRCTVRHETRAREFICCGEVNPIIGATAAKAKCAQLRRGATSDKGV